MELHQNHDNGKQFFVTNSVFELVIIEFARPESHRFVVLDNVSSHLIAGGIRVNVNGFIVNWICKEAISNHESLHLVESKDHFRYSTKVLLPRLIQKRCKNVRLLRPHALLLIENTKKILYLQKVLGFLNLQDAINFFTPQL